MSASLIRRGLELFNEDFKDESNADKKRPQTPGSAQVKLVRSSRRRGGRPGPGGCQATVKHKKIPSVLEEFRKKQKKSNLSDNLKYFMETSYKAADSDTLKIQRYNLGRQSRNKRDQPQKAAKKPESVFTEEEFQQFQKEYFGQTGEDNDSNAPRH